jgi:prevent-host-death family protein
MPRENRAVSVSDLHQETAAVMRRVRGSKRPLVITERGRAAAVLVSVETYERQERERVLLHELARGDREITAGRGFSLARVLADADKVLSRSRR